MCNCEKDPEKMKLMAEMATVIRNVNATASNDLLWMALYCNLRELAASEPAETMRDLYNLGIYDQSVNYCNNMKRLYYFNDTKWDPMNITATTLLLILHLGNDISGTATRFDAMTTMKGFILYRNLTGYDFDQTGVEYFIGSFIREVPSVGTFNEDGRFQIADDLKDLSEQFRTMHMIDISAKFDKAYVDRDSTTAIYPVTRRDIGRRMHLTDIVIGRAAFIEPNGAFNHERYNLLTKHDCWVEAPGYNLDQRTKLLSYKLRVDLSILDKKILYPSTIKSSDLITNLTAIDECGYVLIRCHNDPDDQNTTEGCDQE